MKRKQHDKFLTFKSAMKFKQIQSFAKQYRVSKELGKGNFGVVKIGQHRRSGMPCAVKIIKKQSLQVAQVYQELNKNEFEILEETQHPHITRIFDLLEDKTNYYIVAELMAGGNLLERLSNRVPQKFTEREAAGIIKQVLLALNCMHLKNIMHRDLKPENILCEESADINSNEIMTKLTDFGFATRYDPDGERLTLCLGTPMYMAPELCKEEAYDFKVDVWSIGVITYVLLTGTPPFYDKSGKNSKDGICKDVIKCEPDFSALQKVASEKAVEFVRMALQKDPNERPTIAQLLKTSWIEDL